MESRKRIGKSTSIALLKLLERNNFDFDATSKQACVDIKTLEDIYKKYSYEVFEIDDVKNISKEYNNFVAELDKDFLKRANSLREEVISRLKELIPNSKNINELSVLLKILNEFIENNSNNNGNNNINLTFLQKIENINNITTNDISNNSTKRLKNILYEQDYRPDTKEESF